MKPMEMAEAGSPRRRSLGVPRWLQTWFSPCGCFLFVFLSAMLLTALHAAAVLVAHPHGYEGPSGGVCPAGYTVCSKCCDWNTDCSCDEHCANAPGEHCTVKRDLAYVLLT